MASIGAGVPFSSLKLVSRSGSVDSAAGVADGWAATFDLEARTNAGGTLGSA